MGKATVSGKIFEVLGGIIGIALLAFIVFAITTLPGSCGSGGWKVTDVTATSGFGPYVQMDVYSENGGEAEVEVVLKAYNNITAKGSVTTSFEPGEKRAVNVPLDCNLEPGEAIWYTDIEVFINGKKVR